jgi:hypothetical protein
MPIHLRNKKNNYFNRNILDFPKKKKTTLIFYFLSIFFSTKKKKNETPTPHFTMANRPPKWVVMPQILNFYWHNIIIIII